MLQHPLSEVTWDAMLTISRIRGSHHDSFKEMVMAPPLSLEIARPRGDATSIFLKAWGWYLNFVRIWEGHLHFQTLKEDGQRSPPTHTHSFVKMGMPPPPS